MMTPEGRGGMTMKEWLVAIGLSGGLCCVVAVHACENSTGGGCNIWGTNMGDGILCGPDYSHTSQKLCVRAKKNGNYIPSSPDCDVALHDVSRMRIVGATHDGKYICENPR